MSAWLIALIAVIYGAGAIIVGCAVDRSNRRADLRGQDRMIGYAFAGFFALAWPGYLLAVAPIGAFAAIGWLVSRVGRTA